MFKKYHKGKKNEKKNEKKNGYSFYNWILDNKPNYIQDYDKLMKIIEMFAEPKSKKIDNIEIVEKSIDKQKMWEILEEDGFLCSSFLKSTQRLIHLPPDLRRHRPRRREMHQVPAFDSRR